MAVAFKKLFLGMLFCFLVCLSLLAQTGSAMLATVPPLNKSLALKPPMGWNSWDCLGWGATETEVKTAGNYMAKNLKHLGYEYIVVDMLWYGDKAASDFEAFVQETISSKPHYTLPVLCGC